MEYLDGEVVVRLTRRYFNLHAWNYFPRRYGSSVAHLFCEFYPANPATELTLPLWGSGHAAADAAAAVRCAI